MLKAYMQYLAVRFRIRFRVRVYAYMCVDVFVDLFVCVYAVGSRSITSYGYELKMCVDESEWIRVAYMVSEEFFSVDMAVRLPR